MLFSYIYVPHKMEKMQEFIDFVFHDVWCNAPKGVPFSTDLFIRNSDLHEVMLKFQWGDTAGGDFFFSHVERTYNLFTLLSPAEIIKFKLWYQGNNNIEKVCANDPGLQPARYADIAFVHKAISEELETFFKGLYSKSLLGLAVLKDKIGDIDDHYLSFVKTNKLGKCPFCGIADTQGEYHSTREAYDHYLPKSLYPFNSINFRNLVPACHKCNSSYKTSKDPAYTPKDPARSPMRRKFFYPFSTTAYTVEVNVQLEHSDIETLKRDDVTLEFGPPALNEEIETWKDVYGIEERYKAKCCSADARDWLEQLRIQKDLNEIDPAASLKTIQQLTENAPFANSNFLRRAYLEGCQRRGILDAIAGSAE